MIFEIHVRVSDCVSALEENKNKYLSFFNKETENWHKDNNDSDLLLSFGVTPSPSKEKPVSYHDRYDLLLEMLEKHNEDYIVLNVDMFKKIFRDDWL